MRIPSHIGKRVLKRSLEMLDNKKVEEQLSNHSMKDHNSLKKSGSSVRSQVIEDDLPKDSKKSLPPLTKRPDSDESKNSKSPSSGPNNNGYDATRRRSSWAFWQNNQTETSTTTTTSTDKTTTKTTINTTRESDMIESSIKKDRSASWAFWPSSQGNNTNGPRLTNVILNTSEGFKSINPETPPPKKKPKNDNNDYNDNNNNSKGSKRPKRPNMIVPDIESVLPPISTKARLVSNYEKLRYYLRFDQYIQTRSLLLKPSPTHMKRVMIIGVHGFFPTKMVRSLLGEPTGTSLRFTQVAEQSLLSWCKENEMEVEIQKIALEKEGKVFDRVEFFFNVLKSYREDLNKADFVFICAHSQGCPVSIMLASKLIEHGIIEPNKHIGLLCMAGVNNGPMNGMDQSLILRAYSTIENESMLELFEFQKFNSLQSRKYLDSLKNLIINNVKVTFVGSIDDQLVPLYSSIASHVKHPNIFKAVYIDGETNTPDFVSRIVKLSCTLQNLGYSDHDVIKEISYALAGPLTGGGHSKIYNETNVYKLALNFTLRTQDSPIIDGKPIKYKSFDIKKLGLNPFNLPWCVRGLFFEVMKHLPNGNQEIKIVFNEFDEWNPESKVLKDVKYRLNGIKSKL